MSIIYQLKLSIELVMSGIRFVDKLRLLNYLVLYKLRRIFGGNETDSFVKFSKHIKIRDKYFQRKHEISYIYELITLMGIYEGKSFLEEIFNINNRSILDLGSNIGRISFFFVNQNFNRKAVLVDANPFNIEFTSGFSETLDADMASRLIFINKGLSDITRKLKFYYGEKYDCKGTFDAMRSKRRKLKNNMVVKVEKLSDILSEYELNLNDFDIIKIDIEGFENRVIKDILDLYKKEKRIVMLIEITPQNYFQIEDMLESSQICYSMDQIDQKNYIIVLEPEIF